MSQDSTSQHRAEAEKKGPIPLAVVTVSDTRTPETDVNYHFLRDAIEAAGHVLAGYRLIPDEPERVAAVLDELVDAGARGVLFNGGTGIARRDTTFDALSGKLEKLLPGFGELFRMLSWDQVRSAAMLSRATAGIYRNAVVFSTPGSPKAVRLAWEKLIAPEIQHLVFELEK